MKTFRKYLNLFCISLGASCIFKLAMIKDVYYDDMQAAFNATNVQMGLLITFFAITQALAYLPGGWLVDLVPVKYLMPVGLIGTGLLGFWEATFPSYGSASGHSDGIWLGDHADVLGFHDQRYPYAGGGSRARKNFRHA